MRGRRRTLAGALGDALAGVRGAEAVTVPAAFAEACGPGLAREASMRGVTKEGHLLVVASSQAWAAQLRELAPVICERVNRRLRRTVALGLDVHVAPPR